MTKWACLSVLAAGASGLSLPSLPKLNGDVVHLFSDATAERLGKPTLEAAFNATFNHYMNEFDFNTYARFEEAFGDGLSEYTHSDAYTAYKLYPNRPHCDKISPGQAVVRAHQISRMSPFPGGPNRRTFGSSFGKRLFELASKAQGPAAAGLIPPLGMAQTGLAMGMGTVMSSLSAVVSIVPPTIPPPVWINKPLPCMPMITGHVCTGAVLFPITMADFVIADVTDSQLDGVIAGFPNLYASRVGKTDENAYKKCFSAFMSMHCSAIFPRCTTPFSRDSEMIIGGRVPTCLHVCINTLANCPGMWMEDIVGVCSKVSIPPFCTQAFFSKTALLPPQYQTRDDTHPFSAKCPKPDVGGLDSSPSLYDPPLTPASPILAPQIGQSL